MVIVIASSGVMRWGGDPNEGSPWSAHKRYQLCNSSIRLFITRWPYIVTSLKALNEREGVGGLGRLGSEERGITGGWLSGVTPPAPTPNQMSVVGGGQNMVGRNIGEYCNYEMYLVSTNGTCLWMGMEGDAQNTPE